MDAREAVGRRYVEHLTDRDLLALTGDRPEQVPALRRRPELLLDLLDRPTVTDALLTARPDEPERFRHVSPFLVFAAAVHRAAGALVGRTHVPDRVAPRTRLPVFDGPVLAAFAAEPSHRLFLAELLASYARLGSGTTWRRGERGWQRRRWDALDLPRLAEALEAEPADRRPAAWRRLGDAALFLAGVFPEHAERSLSGGALLRLHRTVGVRDPGTGPVTELLEDVAGRAYGQAGAVPSGVVPSGVVEAPRSARRVLTLVADRYLYPGDAVG